MARNCGVTRNTSDLLVDESGYLSAQIQINSEISLHSRTYNLRLGLPDSHYNRFVIGTLVILGMKYAFSNLKILSKTSEGLESLYEQADKIFDRLKKGTYGLADRRPKKNGERNFSAPQLTYYLLMLKAPGALTREQIMALNAGTFNLAWITEYKQNTNVISYSAFKGKKLFTATYEKEILNIRGIISILKSRGKL